MSQAQSKQSTIKKSNGQYQSIRISQKTKTKMDSLLDKINMDSIGGKVKPDRLIEAALEKIDGNDISALRDSATSNLVYFERAFSRQKSKDTGLSKDEFFALVLTGKVKIPELEKRLRG